MSATSGSAILVFVVASLLADLAVPIALDYGETAEYEGVIALVSEEPRQGNVRSNIKARIGEDPRIERHRSILFRRTRRSSILIKLDAIIDHFDAIISRVCLDRSWDMSGI